eukprot:12289191-Ditylum_brightwellii.AAC.1
MPRQPLEAVLLSSDRIDVLSLVHFPYLHLTLYCRQKYLALHPFEDNRRRVIICVRLVLGHLGGDSFALELQ